MPTHAGYKSSDATSTEDNRLVICRVKQKKKIRIYKNTEMHKEKRGKESESNR